jgi:hypothetical protein
VWRPAVGVAVFVVALLGGFLPGPAVVGAQESPSPADIDVLTATREDVRQVLADLDSRYATQRAAVERAEEAQEQALEAVERAEARVALAEHEVELARATVAEYAVEAYIRPPAQDSLRVLSLRQAEDASYASNVIRILTQERHKVVDLLVARKAEADRERALADETVENARRAANDAQVQLVELDRTRAEKRSLASSLDDRLDAALAEVAALVEIDRQMAEELAAQELALREAGPPAPIPAVATTGGGRAAPVSDLPVVPAPVAATRAPSTTTRPSATPTTRPSATPTTSPSATPTTRPPSTSPTGVVTWSQVTSVGGIWVHTSIAGNVRGLLNAATAAGLNLAGGGYRDPAAQIATRRANCGPTYYDIYEKPASQCTPPTARPGQSMHERGLAIDFTSGGRLITTRSDPAFIWLSNNAARFGLYNLPSEPWHWSTNGN